MNKIIDTLFEDCLSLSWHLEKDDIPDLAEQVRQKLDISREELSKAVLDLISDEDFNLVAYAYEKEFIDDEEYTRNDVILELKLHLWSYLFPENELSIEEKLLVFDVIQVIYKNRYGEDRWILRSDVFLMISRLIEKDFFDNDFFHQALYFAGNIEVKSNEGIDINGFNKKSSSVRWKSETDYTLAPFPSEPSEFP